MLDVQNTNHFFIRKQDFDAPNSYNLHILKPSGRSKIRTFLAVGTQAPRQKLVAQIQQKFFSQLPQTSQNRSKHQQTRTYVDLAREAPNQLDLGGPAAIPKKHLPPRDSSNAWARTPSLPRPSYIKTTRSFVRQPFKNTRVEAKTPEPTRINSFKP